MMRLDTLIKSLDDLDEDLTICARRPWTEASEAIVVKLEDGPVPRPVKQAGYEYFIEVAVAREAMQVFEGSPPSDEEKVELVLYYAENDAFPKWVHDL